MNNISEKLLEYMLEGNKVMTEKLFKDIFNKKDALVFTEKILTEVMDKVGIMWEAGEISLAQYYLIGIIAEEMVNKCCKNNCESNDEKKQNNLNIAIVTLEDYHGLGRKIVLSFLNSAGFVVKDYGIGRKVDEVVNLSVKDKVDILLVSTLMLPAALKVKDLTEKLKEKNPEIKIVVGGAPFKIDKSLWKEVKANEFGETATDAVKIVKRMVENEKYNI
ncbi:methylmalonyl-CoA mutase cobalamin-binding domain/chain [Thermosipho japonicus]|uniref:Methylmalonyl-CoA mutase cobalamin-binding domain/chain n=1 Tax=Thermosipho japonicus TaxID=90323 RepID=A0A841GSG6_9BACT|nr:cobalamin-dependent protein [Thermosipho japonicus]MBB6062548.1 methylmalonyl-CoA mutase cobalamin-binding domain/chain [Thermosipho japonicus]